MRDLSKENGNRVLSTGVAGLDDVLAGGLPAGHIYLFDGNPGTGKTTLGLQFLLNGITEGDEVLYVSLSESERELKQVAASHQWPLDGLNIFELLPVEDLRAEAQYTVLYPGEVELPETLEAIVRRLEEVRPTRVVVDSLSELRLLSREQLRFRRQMLALKQYFAGRDCTVLLLDDRTLGEEVGALQSIVHGAVRLENLSREYGNKRRRLEVVKLRGVKFREGYHDYQIKTGGVEVYPRLIAADHPATFEPRVEQSGVRALDTLLGGGITRGTSTLIMGPAGCGKSTIGLLYATAAAGRGERAYMTLLDEDPRTLMERAEGLGLDSAKRAQEGNLAIEMVEPAELSPGNFVERVKREVEQRQAAVVVIDSLNGLLASMPSEEFLTIQLHELVTYLNNQGVATILILAQYGILGYGMASPIDVSYLADAILLLRYYESEGVVRQAVSVVKKRNGQHERSIRDLQLGPKGIRVGQPLRRFRGILTGVPVPVGGLEGKGNGDDGSLQQ